MLNLILNTGSLQKLYSIFVNDYLAWIFFAVVVIIVIKDAFSGSIRSLLQHLGVAILVAVILFGVEVLFGPSGIFTRTGTGIVKEAVQNVILR